MAYSRWGGSRWYTYWRCQDEATENRKTSIFKICCIAEFTAEEIRNGIEGCLRISVKAEAKQFPLQGVVTEAERDELRACMLRFLADVDDEYPE